MTDQEHNFNLGKIAFNDNNQDRKLWWWLEQSSSRSLIVFFSQLFVKFLINFGCFLENFLSKICDGSIIAVEFFRNAAG